ncbi:MAG: DMT family transporter [Paracoccaceae bacterium]
MDPRAILLGTAFGIMWASAFTSARVIVAHAPPLTALGLRFAISGLIGIAIARALGQSWRLGRRQWAAVVIFGVFQNAAYLGLNFVAMQRIEASLAAIVASSMPLLVALALRVIWGERLRPLGWTGLGLGVTGVAIIMGARLTGGADPWGVALCVLGVVSLTIATLAVRGASGGGDFLMVVGLQMLVGAAVLIPLAAMTEAPVVDWTPALGLAFTYTLLVPGLLATLVWFVLVDRVGATRAAVFHFLTPFFGVLIAGALLGERLGAADLAGAIIVAAGILMVQLARAPAGPGPSA